MKKVIFYLLAIFAVCGMASCSSDNDPEKIELVKGQSSKVSAYANQTSGKIKFTAAASWNAWTSSSSRADSDIDWITLNTTSGSAGEITLTFTLDHNYTGSSRIAYIFIVCEDEQIIIKITQTTEEGDAEGGDEGDEGDEPLEAYKDCYERYLYSLPRPWLIQDYDGNRFSYAVRRFYNMEYVEMITGNSGKCTFKYDYNELIAEDTNGRKWVITTTDDGAYRLLATRIDYYKNNQLQDSYDLEYNGNGELSKCTQVKNGKTYKTTELTWSNRRITSVETTCNGKSTTLVPTYVYNDYLLIENVCGFMMYDTQLRVGPDAMELFYYLGIFGGSTEHLIASTTITEQDGDKTHTTTTNFEYTLDSENRPVKMVGTETKDDETSTTSVYDFSWAECRH